MKSDAQTVDEYLAGLPEDRRAAIEAVRAVVRKNLSSGYEEGMQYGMIGYYVPHSVYPPGYHCDRKQPLPFASLASQKNYMAVYLMCIYGNAEHEAWFREAWAATGKKLNMGKSCVRFKRIDDLALNVIGGAIKRVPAKKFIAHYKATLTVRRESVAQPPSAVFPRRQGRFSAPKLLSRRTAKASEKQLRSTSSRKTTTAKKKTPAKTKRKSTAKRGAAASPNSNQKNRA